MGPGQLGQGGLPHGEGEVEIAHLPQRHRREAGIAQLGGESLHPAGRIRAGCRDELSHGPAALHRAQRRGGCQGG